MQENFPRYHKSVSYMMYISELGDLGDKKIKPSHYYCQLSHSNCLIEFANVEKTTLEGSTALSKTSVLTSLRCHDNSISTNSLSNFYFYHCATLEAFLNDEFKE